MNCLPDKKSTKGRITKYEWFDSWEYGVDQLRNDREERFHKNWPRFGLQERTNKLAVTASGIIVGAVRTNGASAR